MKTNRGKPSDDHVFRQSITQRTDEEAMRMEASLARVSQREVYADHMKMEAYREKVRLEYLCK